MAKIKAVHPVVELDGDDMTRVIWQFIRDRLVLPHLDVDLKYYDLGVQSRDATGDQVTADAAQAVLRYGAGVKCPAIGPDEARVEEFRLKARFRPPAATIGAVLGGAVLHEPVVIGDLPRPFPGPATRPAVVARPALDDQDGATELRVPGEGTLTVTFTPTDGAGSEPVEREVCAFPGPGTALAVHSLDAPARDFARAVLRHGLERRFPVYLSTRNTALKRYDGRFRDLFQEVYDAEFRADFERADLTYEHRPAGDMVAEALKGDGGWIWAGRGGHDGDLRSALVSRGFGTPGLMTSVLVTPDGRTLLAEPAHGTVTRHYRLHQQGRPTSTNPIASVCAWSRGLAHRGRLDGTPEVVRFADALVRVCAETVEGGQMTADLALLFGPGQPWLTTTQFLEALEENLLKALAAF
ncbi:NADP-dependent isocitrate dehydrogenase [Streptomyces coeruleoprunus]|uniref:Isocitrate dehydrogenase [NADP] n=1 Tax=Streptomyces coeruleoprunus TaxID=285563 RepID=A0ABV9XLN7_9ACTN